MKKIYILMTLSAALTGCSILPLPVKDSPAATTDQLPFDALNDFDKVKLLYKNYYNTYIEEAKKKRSVNQYAGETSFYSSIVGVLGGVFSSTSTAIAGGGVAAGSGLFSDRYRLQVQAQNYETAADTMLCMYRASQNIDNSDLDVTIDNHQARPMITEAAVDGFLTVRDKLYRLQSTFELGKPDPNKLKDALTGKPSGTTVRMNVTGLLINTPNNPLLDYKNKIDACVAKISG